MSYVDQMFKPGFEATYKEIMEQISKYPARKERISELDGRIEELVKEFLASLGGDEEVQTRRRGINVGTEFEFVRGATRFSIFARLCSSDGCELSTSKCYSIRYEELQSQNLITLLSQFNDRLQDVFGRMKVLGPELSYFKERVQGIEEDFTSVQKAFKRLQQNCTGLREENVCLRLDVKISGKMNQCLASEGTDFYVIPFKGGLILDSMTLFDFSNVEDGVLGKAAVAVERASRELKKELLHPDYLKLLQDVSLSSSSGASRSVQVSSSSESQLPSEQPSEAAQSFSSSSALSDDGVRTKEVEGKESESKRHVSFSSCKRPVDEGAFDSAAIRPAREAKDD